MRGDRRWFDRVATAGTVVGLSDRELLRRFAARGEDRAFETLVARHGPMVLGVCRRLLDDDHAADDAFQATWLVLVRRAGSLRDGDRLGPWLHGVARRVALRARQVAARRRAVEHVGLTTDPQAAPGPDDDRAERQGALDEEVARMPERLRSPLILCYLEGLTHEEAAHRLGCPLGTVRSRIARSRTMLRDRLARRGLLAPEVGLATPSPVLCPPVPEVLFDATCRAGVGVASGQGFAAAGVSTLVATLTTEAVRMLQITRWKTRLFALLLLGTSAGGVWVTVSLGHDQPPDSGSASPPSLTDDPAAKPNPVDESTEFQCIVVDPDGKPVAGATVVYGSTELGRSGHEEVRTNPDGTFICRRPGSKALKMVVHHEGFQVLVKSVNVDSRYRRKSPVRLSLSRLDPFRATLMDGQGRPVAGAEIQVAMYATIPEIKVEPNGSGWGSFIDYHQVPNELITKGKLQTLFRTKSDASGAFQLQSLGGKGVGLKLRVTGPDGRSFLVRERSGQAEAVTRRPGESGASPSDLMKNQGFVFVSRGELMEKQGFVTAIPGQAVALMAVPAARIEGRVISRAPGQSVSGMIAIYEPTPRPEIFGDLGGRTTVGPDGRFAFDLLSAGTADVVVYGPGANRDWTYRAAQDVKLEPGRTSEITIELIRGVEVTGRVLHVSSEQPVAEAVIGVYGPARPRASAITATALTDDQGRYAYRLPPGETDFYVTGLKRGNQKVEGTAGFTLTIPDGVTSFQVPPIYVRAEAVKPD